jgi:hypothetical protein
MKHTLDQQLNRLKQREYKLLNKPENPMMKNTISPALEKIQNKIPQKLKSTLNMAFYKGFQLVFEKGNTFIEKTYNKDKIELEYDINDYALDKKLNKKHMNRLDKQSKQSTLLNSSFTVVEGSVLGVLGIGLPDIPLFLSVVIKNIYEVALSYGYPYDTEEERTFILLLIASAMSKGDKQKEFDQLLDNLSADIDHNITIDIKPDAQMKITAEVLSDALLTAKFIQGIPVIGAVGGIVNFNILNRVSSYARIKYKKRYLNKKIKGQNYF